MNRTFKKRFCSPSDIRFSKKIPVNQLMKKKGLSIVVFNKISFQKMTQMSNQERVTQKTNNQQRQMSWMLPPLQKMGRKTSNKNTSWRCQRISTSSGSFVRAWTAITLQVK
jgi:hypothetical protein